MLYIWVLINASHLFRLQMKIFWIQKNTCEIRSILEVEGTGPEVKPSSKIFYWPFQGGTSFVDLLCFCSVLCLLCFVRVCLYVLCGHLLGKGWPLGSRLWCLLWVCHFPIGILGQVWSWLYRFLIFATLLLLYNLCHALLNWAWNFNCS